MGSPYDVSYRGTHALAADPDLVWSELAQVDRFQDWWPWMRDIRLTGSALEPGSSISFRVHPPAAFTLGITIDVIDSAPAEWIEGEVSGDLSGTARLELRPARRGSEVEVGWEVAVDKRSLRRFIHAARPVLLWGQGWAVERSLHAFRSHLGSLCA